MLNNNRLADYLFSDYINRISLFSICKKTIFIPKDKFIMSYPNMNMIYNFPYICIWYYHIVLS